MASKKAIGDAEFEGPLERDLLTILEFDTTVERYEVQPVRIEYFDETGCARHYTPDVLIHFRKDSGELTRTPLLCEVKPIGRLRTSWTEVRRKVRAGRAYSKARGWRFRVLTERHIRTPYFENARFLLPHTRLETDLAFETRLLDRLGELRLTTPETLLAAVYWDDEHRGILLPSLWKLIGQGRIACDLSLRLTMASELWPTE
jgi:hypothetical protein